MKHKLITSSKTLKPHPYIVFGFKPVKVNLGRTYLYHATSLKDLDNKLNQGIKPPVFVAIEPEVSTKIVKLVHSTNNLIVLKINVKGLPIYKDLYWENDEKQQEKGFKQFKDPVAMTILSDMILPLKKLTKGKIFYIPVKVPKNRIQKVIENA